MFLHASMLAALAGALLPLALHFLAKARYRSLDWGAMMFLDDATAKRVATGRLRQAILLAIRSAIIAAVAFAMARPVADAASFLAAREPGSLIILLDASTDSAAGGKTHFDLARQAAAELIAVVGPNDRVAVGLASGDIAALEPSADLAAVSARLAELSPDTKADPLADVFARCTRKLTAMNRPTDFVLITDGRSTAGVDIDRAAADLRSALAARHPQNHLHVIRIPTGAAPSVSLRDFRLAEPVVRDVPIDCDVVVQNDSHDASRPVVVAISEGDHILAGQSISLRAAETRSIRITLPSLGIGPHTLTATIDSSMRRLDAAVTVRDAIRVVVIADDEPESKAAADYVRFALEPFRSVGERTADGFTVRVAQTTSRTGLIRQRDDVAVVAGVSSLSPDQAKELADFALAGGGVIFLPGPSSDIEAWNNALFDEGKGPLSAAIAESTDDELLQTGAKSHVILGDSFRVDRSFRVVEQAADARVTATLVDGRPLLIERPFGYGRAALLTVALDPAWTDWPTTDGFLAAMQNWVRRMTPSESATVAVGQPLLARFEVAGVRNVTVVTPSELARDAEVRVVGGFAFVRFAGTTTPGRYVVRLRGEVIEQRRVFLVRAIPPESAPRTSEDWTRVASLVGAPLIDYTPGKLAGHFAFAGRGRELWPMAILAAAALLVAEMLLVGRFTRRVA